MTINSCLKGKRGERGWINVNDSLPDDNLSCVNMRVEGFCGITNFIIFTGFHHSEFGWCYYGKSKDSVKSWPIKRYKKLKVTHWKPINDK
jgi:hypothetical protein